MQEANPLYVDYEKLFSPSALRMRIPELRKKAGQAKLLSLIIIIAATTCFQPWHNPYWLIKLKTPSN